jgi:hypothetical protein
VDRLVGPCHQVLLLAFPFATPEQFQDLVSWIT